MTCRDFAELAWRYTSGELDYDERFEFDAHLAVCPDCVRYLKGYRDTIEISKAAFTDSDSPVPDDVPEDVIRAILAARSKR